MTATDLRGSPGTPPLGTAPKHGPRAALWALPPRLRPWPGRVGWALAAWVVSIAFFIPVLWMVITAFKPESAAETWPPKFFFTPTLSEFRLAVSGMGPYLTHSVIATAGSTLLVLVLGIPAAYALSVHPVGRWRDGLFFFISTKMLPIVAAIGPLYVIALKTHLLDSIWLLIILYTAMNLPLAIWMIRSFMLEVPGELLEAARLDGAGRIREIREVILPITMPGLVSTALICVIFAWNELFLAINLTVTNAATLPMFLISSVPQEGLFIAHLCAAATVASVPVIIVGWIAQRSLVRGLAMGAIK
jgi:sorbitol/mannitol transport system permease protein